MRRTAMGLGPPAWQAARAGVDTVHAYLCKSPTALAANGSCRTIRNTSRSFPFSAERTERRMTRDTGIKKVSSGHSPKGPQGELYLATGDRVSMRLWRDEEPTRSKPSHRHEYEVVGYVISGRAELEIEGQVIPLEPGDSWLVPPNAEHTYRILETFTAVEATAPPARVHSRDGR